MANTNLRDERKSLSRSMFIRTCWFPPLAVFPHIRCSFYPSQPQSPSVSFRLNIFACTLPLPARLDFVSPDRPISVGNSGRTAVRLSRNSSWYPSASATVSTTLARIARSTEHETGDQYGRDDVLRWIFGRTLTHYAERFIVSKFCRLIFIIWNVFFMCKYCPSLGGSRSPCVRLVIVCLCSLTYMLSTFKCIACEFVPKYPRTNSIFPTQFSPSPFRFQ